MTTPLTTTQGCSLRKRCQLPSWGGKKESLKNIMARIQEVGRHKKATTFTYNLIYSGLGVQGLFMLCIVLYFVARTFLLGRNVIPTSKLTTKSHDIEAPK